MVTAFVEEISFWRDAIGGMLKRHLAPKTLEKLLVSELISEPEQKNSTLKTWLSGHFKTRQEQHEKK